MAQVAEAADRFEDMISYLRPVLTTPVEGSSYVILSDKEKNMFSVAYKSITSNQRNSIRVLQMALKKPDVADNKEICDEITTFMETLKGELKNKCDDVVALCNRLLENPDLSPEDFVFYYKMIGDYYRYLAEFMEGKEKEEIAGKANDAYQKAVDAGVKGKLSPCSLSILGLALKSVRLLLRDPRGLCPSCITRLLSPVGARAGGEDVQ